MKEGYIQIEGKFYQESDVVMLPTDKASPLVLNSDGHLEYDPVLSTYGGVKQQHLYFLTNEEAKVGEWIMYGKIASIVVDFMKDWNLSKWKKIIASTDPKLNKEGIPRASTSFIQKYCELGGISKVLVELTWSNRKMWVGHRVRENFRPRVAPDNTITIKPIPKTKS